MPGQITQPTAMVTAVPVAQLAPLAVTIATDPGNGALDVALAPDELGRLHMHVTTEGDTLRIAMMVERPETLDLLRRHADQLLADLRQAGFGSATLSFGQGSANDARNGNPTPVVAQGPAAAPDLPPETKTQPAHLNGQGAGNAPLDLRL